MIVPEIWIGKKSPNKANALGGQKRRSSLALLLASGDLQRCCRTLVARRKEPHNKRIERMSTSPSKLVPAATAHPRAVSHTKSTPHWSCYRLEESELSHYNDKQPRGVDEQYSQEP
ncbi:hypothetical protein DPF_1599 [Desulfoplanes formicivorans]|uniref:Uncharacterized protein n=1 Tax=Desulfoplanes formicivorans TaxID=1592317 RepID=A0A194AFM9_9BACT|nr:hypothetical protein DPF_1599 [Desulfoplanes formicivorans]